MGFPLSVFFCSYISVYIREKKDQRKLHIGILYAAGVNIILQKEKQTTKIATNLANLLTKNRQNGRATKMLEVHSFILR